MHLPTGTSSSTKLWPSGGDKLLPPKKKILETLRSQGPRSRIRDATSHLGLGNLNTQITGETPNIYVGTDDKLVRFLIAKRDLRWEWGGGEE
jgi:hypothetical protein